MTSRRTRGKDRKPGGIYQGPSLDLANKPYRVSRAATVKKYESKIYKAEVKDVFKEDAIDAFKEQPKQTEVRVYEHEYVDVLKADDGQDDAYNNQTREDSDHYENGHEMRRRFELSKQKLDERRATLRSVTIVRIRANLDF